MVREVNFDGIVGPTHNYAGLSRGNIASTEHRRQRSYPRRAALQGLAKCKFVAELGIEQAVLPPVFRPRIDQLRQLGFAGDAHAVIRQTAHENPLVLAASYSASSMWTANAATVCPSIDSSDDRLQFTIANLGSHLHRAMEAESTYRNLSFIFEDSANFWVHSPLPANAALLDEGAANHTRLANTHQERGLHVFVYGADTMDESANLPNNFPARQTRLASETIARKHHIPVDQTLFLKQSPSAIDAGVFHNDVIAVGNEHVLLVHEAAFADFDAAIKQLKDRFADLCPAPLQVITIGQRQLTVGDAVASYLFNSQIVTCPDGQMAMLCPAECQKNDRARACLDEILSADNPIGAVYFLDLRESMNNGGGPACLRLRVPMTDGELAAMHQGVRWSEGLHQELTDWVTRHYRESLDPGDLADPRLFDEIVAAFSALSKILQIPTEVLIGPL